MSSSRPARRGSEPHSRLDGGRHQVQFVRLAIVSKLYAAMLSPLTEGEKVTVESNGRAPSIVCR